MKLSTQLMFWISLAFSALCLAYAYLGFSALDPAMSEDVREASRGYAWFWTFLAAVALVFGVLSWMMKEGKLGRMD